MIPTLSPTRKPEGGVGPGTAEPETARAILKAEEEKREADERKADFIAPPLTTRLHAWYAHRRRQLLLMSMILAGSLCGGTGPLFLPPLAHLTGTDRPTGEAAAALASLPVRKGGESLTDDPFGLSTDSFSRKLTGSYSRDAFAYQQIDSNGDGCTIREDVLHRDLVAKHFAPAGSGKPQCTVLSGTLRDPYTGERISFRRGPSTSSRVQIDHVVALHNAWDSGASGWSARKRRAFGNDLQNLLAVSGPANQEKSDADASQWLPEQERFRCDYVSRQIGVKQAYGLSVTQGEKNAMRKQLTFCPGQKLVTHYPRKAARNRAQQTYRRTEGDITNGKRSKK